MISVVTEVVLLMGVCMYAVVEQVQRVLVTTASFILASASRLEAAQQERVGRLFGSWRPHPDARFCHVSQGRMHYHLLGPPGAPLLVICPGALLHAWSLLPLAQVSR